MRYILPTLSVSGASGKRARRREAARLAQRQGAARRGRLAVAPPRLLESFFLALRVLVIPANAAVLTKRQATELTKGSALITVHPELGFKKHGNGTHPPACLLFKCVS
jgi:hypothetical protein